MTQMGTPVRWFVFDSDCKTTRNRSLKTASGGCLQYPGATDLDLGVLLRFGALCGVGERNIKRGPPNFPRISSPFSFFDLFWGPCFVFHSPGKKAIFWVVPIVVLERHIFFCWFKIHVVKTQGMSRARSFHFSFPAYRTSKLLMGVPKFGGAPTPHQNKQGFIHPGFSLLLGGPLFCLFVQFSLYLASLGCVALWRTGRNIPTRTKMELGGGGDAWNSICGSIFPFMVKTR